MKQNYVSAKKTRSFGTRLLVAFGLSLAAGTAAHTMGYASSTCEELWEHKIQIHRDNALCFTDQKAIDMLGNDSCRYKKLSDIEFSSGDKYRLDLIAYHEEKKKCPTTAPPTRAAAPPKSD